MAETRFDKLLGVGVAASIPAQPIPAGARYIATDGTPNEKYSDGAAWQAMPGGGGGGAGGFTSLLDYIASTDLATAAAVVANTWTDLGTNQTFTVTAAASRLSIAVRGNAWGAGVSAGTILGWRVVIDSAGTPQNIFMGGNYQVTSSYANYLAGGGTLYLAGLSAAAHTIKVQVSQNGGGSSTSGIVYCRPASSAMFEGLAIRIVETGS